MSTLDITGYVTRTELGSGNLDLNTDTYKIITWGPGEVQWERQTVGTPFFSGRYLVNARKVQMESLLGIRVTGLSKAHAQTELGALLAAFEQFEYELSITIEGVEHRYACEPADYSIGEGGQIQKFHLMSYKQEVTFTIPRMPKPVAGAF